MATASAARWMVLSRASPAEPGREPWEAESLRPGSGFHRGGQGRALGFHRGGRAEPSEQPAPTGAAPLAAEAESLQGAAGAGLGSHAWGVQGTFRESTGTSGSPPLLLVPHGGTGELLGLPGGAGTQSRALGEPSGQNLPAPLDRTGAVGAAGPCTHPREAENGQAAGQESGEQHPRRECWPNPTGREGGRGRGDRGAPELPQTPSGAPGHSGIGTSTHLRSRPHLLVQAVAMEGVWGPSERCKARGEILGRRSAPRTGQKLSLGHSSASGAATGAGAALGSLQGRAEPASTPQSRSLPPPPRSSPCYLRPRG